MRRLAKELLLPGLRCLLVGYMLAAFTISTVASAMGLEPVVNPKKPVIEAPVSAEPTLAASAADSAAGKMTPKSKPTSGPYLSLVAASISKTDNESSRFSRQINSDFTYSQITQYHFLPRQVSPSLSSSAPVQAHIGTLVGSRPSGTM
jgi:hypothetical protein